MLEYYHQVTLLLVVLFHHTFSEARLNMKIIRVIGLLFAALLAAMGYATAQTQANNTLAATSWLATVEGEAKTRTIAITTVSPKADGVLELQATYSFTGGNVYPVQAQLSQSVSPRQLTLITPADTKIVATERADGSFQGTFTLKDGRVKGIIITRSTGDPQVAVAPTTKGLFQKPGSDVPANCAAFFGGWAGEWPNTGFAVLWVASIDSGCNARVIYTRSTTPPKSEKGFTTATIKGNTLTWPRPDGGTTTFDLKDETLSAIYRGSTGTTNSATMTRVDPSSLATAQAEAATLAALKSIPPSPDVPADCAGYFGSWGGDWAQGQGSWYFRVAEVRSSGDGCIVRYSYSPTKSPVPAKETAAIRSGSVAFICNRSTGGTCVFERKGDIIAASYTNPAGGTNNATFKRVE